MYDSYSEHDNIYVKTIVSLHGGRYPRHSHLHKFWRPSVKGFLGGEESNFPLSY